MQCQNRHILIGISGGVAAYKACELIRLFKRAGAQVRVVLTETASQFITPMQCQALTGEPVYDSSQAAQADHAMDHIELARWADVICIAPATANLIARLSLGLADDLLSTVVLASTAPLVIAPAMNRIMWQHSATQHHIQTLIHRGVRCLSPQSGEQACGEMGPGRLPELSDITAAVQSVLESAAIETHQAKPLHGKQVLITAGPTREYIDPVRYLSNGSSGKMGYALAQVAEQLGATVHLVSGPCLARAQFDAAAHPRIHLSEVDSALEMLDQVLAHIKETSLFIAAAAVSDYRVATPSLIKLKKSVCTLSQLELVENPDIVATVTAQTPHPFTVGFAAETDDLLLHAAEKLNTKHLDMIVANAVGRGLGIEQDQMAVTLLDQSGKRREIPLSDKTVLAQGIFNEILRRL